MGRICARILPERRKSISSFMFVLCLETWICMSTLLYASTYLQSLIGPHSCKSGPVQCKPGSQWYAITNDPFCTVFILLFTGATVLWACGCCDWITFSSGLLDISGHHLRISHWTNDLHSCHVHFCNWMEVSICLLINVSGEDGGDGEHHKRPYVLGTILLPFLQLLHF